MTDRIKDALAGLGSEYGPPPGWERRVLHGVGYPSQWHLVVIGLLAVLLGAAGCGVVVLYGRLDRAEARAMDAELYGQRCRALVSAGDRYCLDNPGMCR